MAEDESQTELEFPGGADADGELSLSPTEWAALHEPWSYVELHERAFNAVHGDVTTCGGTVMNLDEFFGSDFVEAVLGRASTTNRHSRSG